MGMLMHQTWLKQQEANKKKVAPAVETKKEEPKVEPVEEPVRKPGRRKIK